MEEKTKHFELMSNLYRFLGSLPRDADNSRATFQWLLEYSRVGSEKLLLAGLDRGGKLVPLAEVGILSQSREALRGEVFHHNEVVRQTGQAIMFHDMTVEGNDRFRTWALEQDIRSFWVFPIASRGVVLGTLGVAYADVREITQVEQDYWTRVTNTLALFMALVEVYHERQRQETRLATAVEMANSGILAFWANGEVAFHNQRFLDLFHVRSELIRGPYRGVLKVLQDQLVDPEGIARAIERAVISRETMPSFQLIGDLKGIVPRKIRMRLRPLEADGGGTLDGWVAIFDDYTQEYAVQSQQAAFLSLVAHEFRTPITVISGVVEWLLTETETDVILGEQVRLISRETTRLLRLIRELWLSVHLDDPLWVMDSGEVCIVQVVRDESMMRQMGAPLTRITYEGPETARVFANREVIATIVSVVLSNALRFSPQGTPIEVVVTDETEGVRLEVRDRGPGIDPEVADHIFQRMPDPRKRSPVGGIGLGLWLSRQLLDRMSGDICYRPRPDGGSIFTVWFPRPAKGRDHPAPSAPASAVEPA